jgi:hypothetical protein
MQIDWTRTSQGDEEFALVTPAFREGLAVLRSIKDPRVFAAFEGTDNARRFRFVVTPIILNAIDAGPDELVQIGDDAALEKYCGDRGVDWGYILNCLNALHATQWIKLEIVDPQRTVRFCQGSALVQLLNPTDERERDNLDYSRPIEVHTWSDHPEVNSLIDEIYETHFATGNAKIQKKHIKVVLLDLYLAWCEDPKLKVRVSRDVNAYMPRSRYNALHISKTTVAVLDQLIEAGLIEQAIGFYDRETKIGRETKIWPTDALLEKFRIARFGPFDISVHTDQECIVLRDVDPDTDKTTDVEYEDTPQTNDMRELLSAYNELLSRTYIDIPTLDRHYIDLKADKRGQPVRLFINQRDKFVRRIFNRGSWDKGGRFWGGWWQRCPKEWRAAIFLNDQPVSEIDYSGLHVVILYAQEGIDYWKDVAADPYEIEPVSFINNLEQLRSVCKLLMLVALNARDEDSAFSAFRSESENGSYEKTLKNDQLTQILDKLRAKHDRIADRFASDAGIDLMNTDSQITEKIIQHFTDQEVPILTIHDSYLVPFGMEQELEEQMVKAFHEVTGIENVKLKEETHNPLAWEPHSLADTGIASPSTWQVMLQYRTDPPRTDRYKYQYEQFQEWLLR